MNIKVFTYDEAIFSDLMEQQLFCLQRFNHTINFGVNNEILLTLTTNKNAFAPYTIILDQNNLSYFSDTSLFVHKDRRIAFENQDNIYLEKERGQHCYPIVHLEKNESVVFFVELIESKITAEKNDTGCQPLEIYSKQRIKEKMNCFKQAWEKEDMDMALEQLTQILGLGVGLTPTGDDFITGLFASLYAKSAFPAHFSQLACIAKEKTNPVSYAEIREAIKGRFAQLIQNIFITILRGNVHEMLIEIEQLKALGSTSGKDILWGIVFGLNLFRKEPDYGN
ncbi:DUF2877 domain-containing protein [Oceanobacillus neutriphilus]|uniref:DUF2877 domain-containing protein n=1 Tax=Oceanobacillus neutriphilus TaxID=531815 RepID=A0ABQ2NUF1_9BACI|nr:DUF2877 domain-containing protein [Oceanobacillus neutriphilus]GGP10798.1 hypothetical protein GCM10011346_20350 [Oceanobacillus neutriphilus]